MLISFLLWHDTYKLHSHCCNEIFQYKCPFLCCCVISSYHSVRHPWKLSTILMYKPKNLCKDVRLHSTMLASHVSQQSKQAVSAHLVIWWMETEETENEQLRKNHYVLWNSPRNVRTRSITNTLGSHKPTQRSLNNLRKTLPKNVKNLKEDRDKLEWGGRSAYSWDIILFFSVLTLLKLVDWCIVMLGYTWVNAG